MATLLQRPSDRRFGYGTTVACCRECGQLLEKSPAAWDGEPTYVGYLPCPIHVLAGAVYVCRQCGDDHLLCRCD